MVLNLDEDAPNGLDGTGEVIKPNDCVLWHYDGTWGLGRVVSIRRRSRMTWLLDLVWEPYYYEHGVKRERVNRVGSGIRSYNVVVVPPSGAP